MTIDFLLGIYSRLNLNCSRHASFWAICLVSFFGLFRKAHLLPVSTTAFNPKQQFTRSDFWFCEFGVLIKVHWSKTIQLGQRSIDIPLVSIASSPLCPVSAISQAFRLASEASVSSQAFCFRNSTNATLSVFTYKFFLACMKQMLADLGVPTDRYGTHSFRRGGASYALECGVPLDTIPLLGDWKSDAMFLYLHLQVSQRLSAQRVMASNLSIH